MSANRTYGDELADVFTSFAIEKNPTGLSVGVDSAYELGDHIESEWLAEHDRQVAKRAWNDALVHVSNLSDPARTIEITPDRELITLQDVQQAIGDNPCTKGEQK